MTQLREHLQGYGKVQTLSRARIQPIGNGVQLTLGVARQVRPLGQILAQQGRDVSEFFREARAGTPRIRSLHAGQDPRRVVRLTRVPIAEPLQAPLFRLTFPVARDGTACRFRGAVGNRRHVRKLPPAIGASQSRPARLARLTQRGQQFAAQDAPRQHVQRRIDGLCRKLFPHFVRILAAEAFRNLLGRTPLAQVGPDILPQPRVEQFTCLPGLTGPSGRQTLRRVGPIGVAPRPNTRAIVRNE